MTDVCIAVTGKLSDDARQQAGELQRLSNAWHSFVEALKDLPLQPRIAMVPPAPEPVRRRRRRTKPQLVSEPPTAA